MMSLAVTLKNKTQIQYRDFSHKRARMIVFPLSFYISAFLQNPKMA